MKITPISNSTGTPLDNAQVRSPDKIARAKAIASGQQVEEQTEQLVQQPVSNIKRIQMKTQVSPDRESQQLEGVNQEIENPTLPEVPTLDTSEPQTPESEETRPLSPQLAAIAKAKRALQIERAELAKLKAELTQRPIDTNEYVSKADLKANPLKIFETGVTYDELTEAILANHNPEVAQLKQEIAALKQDVDGKLSERDKLQEQQVLTQLKRDVDQLTADGETFEAIRAAKAQDKVVRLIHRTFQETGEIMDVTEAAELIETQLIEDISPFLQTKKVQSKFTPSEPVMQPQKPGTKVMKTLTNRDGATPQLDRRARAMAAFAGTLKRG